MGSCHLMSPVGIIRFANNLDVLGIVGGTPKSSGIGLKLLLRLWVEESALERYTGGCPLIRLDFNVHVNPLCCTANLRLYDPSAFLLQCATIQDDLRWRYALNIEHHIQTMTNALLYRSGGLV
jgi:hypothetical protein